MEFIINDFRDELGIYNSFIVEIEWEHGDRDDGSNGYSGSVSKPFKKGQDEWALEEFLYDLADLMNIPRRDYDDLEVFNKWFNPDFTFKDEVDRLKYEPFVSLDYEEDMVYGDCTCLITDYKVYYFDENSHAYAVIVQD